MGKTALITGVTGQDGSYLSELLLSKGYEVHGVIRRHSSCNMERIEHLLEERQRNYNHFHVHYGDLSDSSNVNQLLHKIKPDEIYNLGAQSHVGVSFEVPEYTADVTGLGTLRMLEALRLLKGDTKFYQASTSELFGGLPDTVPQNEKTMFYPKSPYGAAKLYSYWITVNYRESYGLFTSNGILFNHESPRRGENFVTRKITKQVAKIHYGIESKLSLGNLNAKRDWGYAGDYVDGMWRMLQRDKPGDYVLATGETHTVREFVELAFEEIGINLEWYGEGIYEKGYDKKTGRLLVDIDQEFFRPCEVKLLCGDATKAERELGWKRKIGFRGLIKMMMLHDLEQFEKTDIKQYGLIEKIV